MSATNSSTYYHLPEFVGTDIPNPLTDWNGAMESIDTAIHDVGESAATAIHDSADVAALVGNTPLPTVAQTITGAVAEVATETSGMDTRVNTLEGTTTLMQTQMATLDGKVTALQNADTVLDGRLDTLEAQNGSEILQTTAQTLSGAVNEFVGEIGDLSDLTTTHKNNLVAAINDAAQSGGGGGGGGTIDTEMSTSSENAVQNKVITEYVDNTASGLESMMRELADDAKGETRRGTISAGGTSITLNFTSLTIGATSYITVYTNQFGVNPTNVTYTGSSVTVTIPAQADAVQVSVMIFNRA